MPLSPFRARLAVAGYLAIVGGVAANLMTSRTSETGSERARSTLDHAGIAMDGERLRRLAHDAAGEREPAGRASQPAPAMKRSAPATAPVPMEPARRRSTSQRVGSFAPSSGALVSLAVPGVDPAEARRATVRAVQSELARRGYEPGTADGATGLVTRAAVLAYEHDQGLPLTADPSPEVLAHLRHGTSAPGVAVGLDGEETPPSGHAETVIRSVQQSLRSLGYLTGHADGQLGDDTVRAIREFEMDAGLVPSGRISAPLVMRLARQLNSRQTG
ncbi:MAG: peptidoglycan-binding domain-containing protein [Hyphomicrobiaceae bacterium]|nr:peptidoglycan-binding domain-containing protein [Hyphomicrobiaceae bacterium]